MTQASSFVYYGTGAERHLKQEERTLEAPGPHDILVRIHATAVNPVDAKVRDMEQLQGGGGLVLGYDAAGVVEAVGSEVTRHAVGDEVYYAGSLTRAGSFATHQLVDGRIVGKKPKSLDFVEAAALPLTSITAWELLFDRLEVPTDAAEHLLVIGAAGGVGSVLLQLARARTKLSVTGTASRPETEAWVKKQGALHVLNHHKNLEEERAQQDLPHFRYIASLNGTEKNLKVLPELVAPQGRLAVIDDPPTLDVMPYKMKSASVHWEFMFARPMFETADIEQQANLLDEVARLVDAGQVETTLQGRLGPLTAEKLDATLDAILEGKNIGKQVFEIA